MLKEVLDRIRKETSERLKRQAYEGAVAVINLNMGEGRPEEERHLYNTELVIMPDGFGLLMLPPQTGVTPVPIDASVIAQAYEASQRAIRETDSSNIEQNRADGLKAEIDSAERFAASLSRHQANNWPHPGISATYELPSGKYKAFVDRHDKSITLLTPAGSRIIALDYADVARLEGIASPSVLPNGPNGCPVPKDEQETFSFEGILAKNKYGIFASMDSVFIQPEEYELMSNVNKLTFTTDIPSSIPEGKTAVYCVYDKKISTGGCLNKNPFSKEDSILEIEEDIKAVGHDGLLLAIVFIDKE